MAYAVDDDDDEVYDSAFWEKAIEYAETAVSLLSSSSNPTQPQLQSQPQPQQQPLPQQQQPLPQQHPQPQPQQQVFWSPPQQQQQLFCQPPQPQHPFFRQQHVYVPPPPISYSPPRELSQRLNEVDDNHTRMRRTTDHPFPSSSPHSSLLHHHDHQINQLKRLNEDEYDDNHRGRPFPDNRSHSSNPQSTLLHDEDTCSKQHEINQLKDELGRVSNLLTAMEQECLELKKDREKNEKHLRLVVPVNGSEDAETSCANKPNLKNKEPIEDPSDIRPGTEGVITCKTVGIQTDEPAISTDVTIKKLSVSRKLAGIWEPQNEQSPRNSLVSKLFVACEADLQVLFGFLGLNIPSKKPTTKMAPNHCIQPAEAAKVSHLYLTLTKISYDTGKLGDLLEALVDLSSLQNTMIVHRSLCVLHVVLKHVVNTERRLCRRDNVIVNDPSTSTVNKSSEVTNHPVLARFVSAKKIQNQDNLRSESQPLISWFSLFQTMHQVVTRQCQENIRVEAVSIMNILLLRTDAYTEREMYGEVAVFQSVSLLLKEEAGLGVQKQSVHLLYLLLNCPKLMLMFCSSSKEEGTTAEASSVNGENGHAFLGLGSVLDGLADCLACHGNVASTALLQVLKLQRKTITLLAFIASSGRHGFEIFLGCNLSRRTSFLYLILQILASEIDLETCDCIQPAEDFKERTSLIREALILLNRLASNPQYSTRVLRVLTSRDMAILTIDIASRLSRKSKWPWQSDTTTRQMRELEVVDLARIFKKRVFAFIGEAS